MTSYKISVNCKSRHFNFLCDLKVLRKDQIKDGTIIYIKCLYTLYIEGQGSVRSLEGFCAPFHISQSTREGCIISPLLFVIVFSDVIETFQVAHLDVGAVMLGPLLLYVFFFADDLVLLARTIKDVQNLMHLL